MYRKYDKILYIRWDKQCLMLSGLRFRNKEYNVCHYIISNLMKACIFNTFPIMVHFMKTVPRNMPSFIYQVIKKLRAEHFSGLWDTKMLD